MWKVSNDDQNEPYINLSLSNINKRRRKCGMETVLCKSPKGIVKCYDLRHFSQ